MPNFTGLWTPSQQLQAKGLNIWPAVPGAPTSVTATAGNTSASVAFTAPADTGYPANGITGYTVTSSPGSFTATGAASPLTVTGLTNGTSYTFTVTATNASGTGPASAASSAVTPVVPTYVDEVFSTTLYTGTGASQTVTTDINASANGALFWIKARNGAESHRLTDTVRGPNLHLSTDWTGGQDNDANRSVTATTTGFTTGSTSSAPNTSSTNYVAWTFRKKAKFFDIVTYTGNSSGSNIISHDLGSAPGMVIAKNLTTSAFTNNDWRVWHRGNGTNAIGGLKLNATDAGFNTSATNYSSFTSTTFDAAQVLDTGANPANQNATYVAYLFAHNAGGFGDTGNDNIVSCGRFTTDSSGNATINLGFEPAWIMTKAIDQAEGWNIEDIVRGMPAKSVGAVAGLAANSTATEGGTRTTNSNSTGFSVSYSANITYVYLAIRRPHKAPTLGSQVYQTITRTGSGSSTAVLTTGITTDLLIQQARAGDGYGPRLTTRPQGNKNMITSRDEAESGAYSNNSNPTGWDVQLGVRIGNQNNGWDQGGTTFVNHAFKRAAKFMDIVTWVGDGNYDRPMNHNLGVIPELIIFKNRTSAGVYWVVYHASLGGAPPSNQNYLYLNTTDNGTQTSYQPMDGLPTSTQLILRPSGSANANGANYMSLLFATLAGVSKVGTYTGNGSSQTINCGFTSGARFILIKRTDSTGEWYTWDSTRGIVTGNDPYTSLSSMSAEVTNDDSIDPANSGFIVNQVSASNVNVSSATYVFLAIA